MRHTLTQSRSEKQTAKNNGRKGVEESKGDEWKEEDWEIEDN